jgi:hypothetical protein
MTSRSRLEATPLAIVLVATLIVTIVWFQGWKERLLNNLDTIIFYKQAYGLVHGGQIPDHGQIYSYGSYSPPGTAYLIAPGMLISTDPRLYEVPLNILFYVGTVTLTYFLGRMLGGAWTGAVSALALAVSRLGQRNIIETQLLVVATIFFAYLWAARRKPAALSAALIALAAGLYVYPNILPLALTIPVLWAIYRPPVNWKALAIALGSILVMWFPYLRFEWGRQFVDVRSYVLREQVVQIEGTPVSAPRYCYAALEGESDSQNGTYLPYLGLPGIAQRVVYPEPRGIGTVRYVLCSLALKMARNFNNDTLLFGANRAVNASLLSVFWAGMIALVTWPLMRRARDWPYVSRFAGMKIPLLAALLVLGAAALYVVLSPTWLAKCCTADGTLEHASLLVVKQWQSVLPLVLASVVLGLYLAATAKENWKGLGVLGVLVLVPFAVLVVVSETARADRFWWMWPAQLIVVVITVGFFSQQTRWPRAVFVGLSALLLIMMINVGFYQAKVGDWLANGYAGKSTGQVEAVDFLGAAARARDSSTMTIGYQLQWPHFTSETTVDPSYRTGTWFDFLLLTRQGIHNLNETVEGLTSSDEFRVIEVGDGPGPARPPWPGFQFVARFADFEVFRRS